MTNVGDYQTNDLDRSATGLNSLATSSCKASVGEAGDHVAIEPMHEVASGFRSRGAAYPPQ
jgi:hypothetical protein